MTLDDAAVKVARGTVASFQEAKTSLERLTKAGCSVDQAVGLLEAFARAGHGQVVPFSGWPSIGYMANLVADVLQPDGPERRKGVAALKCGHEVTSTWCSECGAHRTVKP